MELAGKINSNQKEIKAGKLILNNSKKAMPFFQPKLTVGPTDDVYEREADAVADKVMRMGDSELIQTKISRVNIQRKCATCEEEEHLQRKEDGTKDGQSEAPSIVSDVLGSGGNPLDEGSRSFTENRFGYDFSNVRVHTGAVAAKSAQSIHALAYTSGNNIVFNEGQYCPHTQNGKKLLAHELTHTIQQTDTIQPYRPKTAFNFGISDSSTLIEDSFSVVTDKEMKPWIELVTVDLQSQKADANGSNMWVGSAVANYYNNTVKLPDINFTVAGGSPELGRTDAGSFTVSRIEGNGYNSGSNSGTAGVDYDPANREGPGKRYSKDLLANMSFAVFYNGGEALHAGPIDLSSHGCVHVDWSTPILIQQLNYHSVIGLTKVKVKYPKT